MLNRRIGLFLAALVGVLIAAVWTTTIKTDISTFVVSGDNTEEVLLANEMQSGALSRRIILLLTAQDDKTVTPGLVNDLIRGLTEISGVIDVWRPEQSRVTEDSIRSVYARYGANLYSLYPETEVPRLLSSEGLEERARILKSALLSPQGSQIKNIAQIDPMLLVVNGFRTFLDQSPSMADQHGKYRTLILETRASGLDVTEQERIQHEILGVFDRLAPKGYRLEMTGVPVFAMATQTIIQADIQRVSLLSCASVALLFLALFRSFASLVRVAVVMLAVISSSVLITNLVFGYVHGLTLAVGTTLIGVCVDYPIHALAHAQSVDRAHRLATISKIWPSMLLGGATTLIGYAALGFSGYPGFQQIAVYAGSGIIVALLATRFVLPGMLHTVPDSGIRIPGVTAWADFWESRRRTGLTVLGLILIVACFGSDRLHWVDDLQKLTPEMNELKARDREIRSRMVSVEPGRFILLSGKDTDTALQIAERVYPILDRLKQAGDLDAYFGMYPWMVSEALQRKNHRVLNAGFNYEVREAWKNALSEQGLSVERLGNPDYSEFDLLTPDEVLNTPIRRLIDHQIAEYSDRTLIMIWIGKHSPEKLRAALKPIAGADYFSQRDLLNKLAMSYTKRAQMVLAAGLISIFVLLWLRFRNPILALKTLAPSVLSGLIIVAIWSSMQTEVSFLHLVGFILVVAICVDYGIFYQENRAGNLQLTYQAMAASMLTSAVAFGSLSAAQTATLKILSGVVSFGVVAGFLLCPLIIRSAASREETR